MIDLFHDNSTYIQIYLLKKHIQTLQYFEAHIDITMFTEVT